VCECVICVCASVHECVRDCVCVNVCVIDCDLVTSKKEVALVGLRSQ
jgi:hypothetical protein